MYLQILSVSSDTNEVIFPNILPLPCGDKVEILRNSQPTGKNSNYMVHHLPTIFTMDVNLPRFANTGKVIEVIAYYKGHELNQKTGRRTATGSDSMAKIKVLFHQRGSAQFLGLLTSYRFLTAAVECTERKLDNYLWRYFLYLCIHSKPSVLEFSR